jgi:predicted nucleic acid-binding protein
MIDRVFVDTNILVYAYDRDAGAKRDQAKDLISGLWENRSGVISTQVIQEFYITLTRKIPNTLSNASARKVIRSFLAWEMAINDIPIILHAMEIEENHRISFWDALIIAAAYTKNCSTILSEDLNHHQTIEGILITNPFL